MTRLAEALPIPVILNLAIALCEREKIRLYPYRLKILSSLSTLLFAPGLCSNTPSHETTHPQRESESTWAPALRLALTRVTISRLLFTLMSPSQRIPQPHLTHYQGERSTPRLADSVQSRTLSKSWGEIMSSIRLHRHTPQSRKLCLSSHERVVLLTREYMETPHTPVHVQMPGNAYNLQRQTIR